MRIDSSAPHTTPAPRQRTAATDTTATPSPAPAPAPAPSTPEPSSAASKGRGAEHRSDVATLRQWVNHPDRRDAMTLPDVDIAAAERRGQGFAKAVEAYRAVLAELPAPPTAPPVTDPLLDPVPPPVAPPVTETVLLPTTDTAPEPDAAVVPDAVVPEAVLTS